MKPIALRSNSYVAAFFALALAASLSASTMTLRLPTLEGATGSTVDVAIDVAGAEKVGALQFEVIYDSSVLAAESARAGALTENALIEVKTDKPGRLFIALVTTDGINGSGTVATASFKVLGAPGKATPLEPAAAQAWEGITHREVLITPVAGKLTVTKPGLPWLWIAVAVLLILLLVTFATRKPATSSTLTASRNQARRE